MKTILENVIRTGNYKLAEMQHKIKKIFLLGDITEDELDALLSMAAKNVSADAERPDLLISLQSFADKLSALEKRIAALEGNDASEDGAHPAWVPWDGVSSNYIYGTIVSHKERLWQSHFEGQNVWEPGTLGTETLWVEFTAES